MSTADARGWRIALVAQSLVNPASDAPAPLREAIAIIEACGYGLLQLPPPGTHALLLGVLCDQVAEYAHHGYAIAAVGVQGEPAHGLHWRRVARLLRARNVALPPRFLVRHVADSAAERQRLTRFLADFDLPEAEQKHWRV